MSGSTGRKLESMGKILLSYLQEHWPGGNALEVACLAKITSGWENEIYSFQLLDTENDSKIDLVLRIYPGQDAQVKSCREFGIMDLLGKTGLPVPAVYLLEQSGSYFTQPFMIMERILGPSLRDLFSEANAEKRKELVTLFCQLFIDLHRWDWCHYHSELAQVLPSAYTVTLDDELERWRGFAGQGLDSALQWLLERYPTVSHQAPCLTHGDFHPDNILMAEGLIPYVIDWGGARLQDFRLDLAWTMLLLSTYGSWEMGELILQEYQTLAGMCISNMGYFQAVAALRRLLSVYISVNIGAEKLGMRPGAAVMMIKDLPHLQKVYQVWWNHTGLELPEILKFLDRLRVPEDMFGGT